jgi:glycosyltransferase involved in cell wall biosynthesis
MPRQKHVLHVLTVPSCMEFIGGQAHYMTGRGYRLSAISSPGEELDRFERSERVPVQAIPMQRRIAPVNDLIALLELWLATLRSRPDILHAHTPKAGFLGMCAGRLAGVPRRIYHLHGLPMMTATWPKRSLLRLTERLACSLAHEVVCVSPSLRQVALQERICGPEKLRVLARGSANGIDGEERFSPHRFGAAERAQIRKRLGIAPDALVIGFVGRLVRDKGVIELARAWEGLRTKHPGAALLLVGPAERADPVPAHILAALRQDPRAQLIGVVEDAAPYYAAMDVLTLPSYREGLPLSLLEGAAMGLPVVATTVTGCVDAVVDGQTGTLVPPGNAQALADALSTYLSSPELRRTHGAAGRDRVRRDFARRDMWEALADLYDALMPPRGDR